MGGFAAVLHEQVAVAPNGVQEPALVISLRMVALALMVPAQLLAVMFPPLKPKKVLNSEAVAVGIEICTCTSGQVLADATVVDLMVNVIAEPARNLQA